MPQAARLYDRVEGTTSGEHTGHVPPHGPLPFTGEISANCSQDVRTNGRPAAFVSSVTTERDACCGASLGTVARGSATVRVNGVPAARIGDALAPHSGAGAVAGGSPDVRIGG